MQQNHYSQANSHLLVHKFSLFFAPHMLITVFTGSQIHPVHILSSYFLKTHFNGISNQHLSFSSGLLPLGIATKTTHYFLMLHIPYISPL